MTATPADVQAKLAAAVTELEKTIAAIEAAQAEVGQLVAPAALKADFVAATK